MSLGRASSPAEVSLARWPDLAAEATSTLSQEEAAILAFHVAENLVGWFGVEQFESYRGKDGLQVHSVDEIAVAVVAKLAPALAYLPEGKVLRMHADGELAQALRHPWDMTP